MNAYKNCESDLEAIKGLVENVGALLEAVRVLLEAVTVCRGSECVEVVRFAAK